MGLSSESQHQYDLVHQSTERHGHNHCQHQYHYNDSGNDFLEFGYSFYTSQTWGMSQNYHLTLHSGFLGEDACVDLLCAAYER